MNLIIRCNYGDDSIALIEFIRQQKAHDPSQFDQVYVVYVDTGWAAQSWPTRVAQGEAYVKRIGFEPIHLTAKVTFADLVLERKSFPSKKFQWCAGFLKGLPLIDWLDEHDPAAEWTIAIAKRQEMYRKPVPEYIEECEYHGERRVWHPLRQISQQQRNHLVTAAGFACLAHKSLECDPCVNSTREDSARLSPQDMVKLKRLELQIGQSMVLGASNESTTAMDQFSMGCGDPFGCGL